MTPDAGTLADLREAVEERAAWFEIEAGLPRDLATDVAFLNVSSRHGLGCAPGVAPFHRLGEQNAGAALERTNALRRDVRGGGDGFTAWLVALPHVQPEAPALSADDLPAGWQDDPAWWARLVCGALRAREATVEA